MKFKRYLLPLALGLTIAFSLMMSTLISINPVSIQRNQQTKKQMHHDDTAILGSIKKQADTVYMPTSIAQTTKNSTLKLTSEKVDILQNIINSFKSWKISSVKFEHMTARKYLALLNTKNAVALNYSAPITLSRFDDLVATDVPGNKSAQINHVLIPLNQPKTIYLLNDKNLALATVKLKKQDLQPLKDILTDKSIDKTHIVWKHFNNKYLMFYQNEVKVPNYSYLLEKQGADMYVTRILGVDGDSMISAKEEKNHVVYSDGINQQMVIHNNTGIATYINYNSGKVHEELERGARHRHPHFKQLTLNQSLTADFNKLIALGVNLDDVRYDEYNKADNTITYRSYINGLPLITPTLYGAYQLQNLPGDGLKLNFSLDALQVPVPVNKKNTVLPPTPTVLKILKEHGYETNKIAGIRLGYTWRQNRGTKQVIDLIPTYFISYNGEWKCYTDPV